MSREAIRELIEDPAGTVDRLVESGERARKNRDMEAAYELFTHALERGPSNPRALTGLGFLYLEVEDHERASSYLERSLDQDPDSERTLYGAALAMLGREEFDAALSYALRLAGSDQLSSRRNGHFIAGKVRYESGAFEQAADEFERAISLEEHAPPNDRRWKDIRFLLSQAYLAVGDKNRALERLRELQGRAKQRSIADQIGRLCLELDRIAEARAVFEQILSKAPRDQRALRGLGQVYLKQHHYDGAIEIFDKVRNLDKGSIHALEGLAESYKGKGDLSRAARYIEQMHEHSNLPEAQLERRLRALDHERARRDAELLRVRNLASLNAMATGIAHELRQPLSVIRLAAQNARRDLEGGETEQLKEDLIDIDQSIGRLDRIIELLRQLSTAGGSVPEPLFITAVVERAMEFFHEQFRSRDIEVVDETMDHQVIADEVAFLRILINLLENARDAMASTAHKRLRLWAVESPDRIQLFVQDSGVGMTRDVENCAFDPFFTTKGAQGVGMGLYIAYNLAKKMNCQLAIRQSKPEHGTTVELTLPRYVGEDQGEVENP